MRPYIDVRSAWPLYVRGYVCLSLVGAPRDITVEQLAFWAATNGGVQNWRPTNEEQEILRFNRFVAD